jgi:hypothetical protein
VSVRRIRRVTSWALLFTDVHFGLQFGCPTAQPAQGPASTSICSFKFTQRVWTCVLCWLLLCRAVLTPQTSQDAAADTSSPTSSAACDTTAAVGVAGPPAVAAGCHVSLGSGGCGVPDSKRRRSSVEAGS